MTEQHPNALAYFHRQRARYIGKYLTAEYWIHRTDARGNALHFGRLIRKMVKPRDAFFSMCLAPLEYVTKSLRQGDPWDLRELEPMVRRMKALTAAYDDRIGRMENSK